MVREFQIIQEKEKILTPPYASLTLSHEINPIQAIFERFVASSGTVLFPLASLSSFTRVQSLRSCTSLT